MTLGATICSALVVLLASAFADRYLRGVGLAAALLGAGAALLLAFGLIMPEWVVEEMGWSRLGGSDPIRAYWRQAGIDARFAALLLGLSFVIQATVLAWR